MYSYNQTLKPFGIWMDGHCSWLNSLEWDISPTEMKETNVTVIAAFHKVWKIHVTILQERLHQASHFDYTFTIKNHSNRDRVIKFVYHHNSNSNDEQVVSMVSSSEKTVMHYNGNKISLLATHFFQHENFHLAVGERETIWNEKTGSLTLSPIWRGAQESMMVTELHMSKNEERVGRVWGVQGETEEDVHQAHYQRLEYNHLGFVAKQIL